MPTMKSYARMTRPSPREVIPALHNGDHLDGVEFMRRYEAMPEDVKAELIDGVVYMASPVRMDHGYPLTCITGWLYNYSLNTPGVKPYTDITVRLADKSIPQPDGLLIIQNDGSTQSDDKGYLVGPPELCVEITYSSISLDRNEKYAVYERFGVQEYLLWNVEDEQIEWFALKNDKYAPLKQSRDGILQSKVFPGLWLQVDAMLNDDQVQVNETLQLGLLHPSHAQFVKKLSKLRK
jgi:Uma2 family endonuclease